MAARCQTVSDDNKSRALNPDLSFCELYDIHFSQILKHWWFTHSFLNELLCMPGFANVSHLVFEMIEKDFSTYLSPDVALILRMEDEKTIR